LRHAEAEHAVIEGLRRNAAPRQFLFRHVRREQNRRADELANLAFDGA
ncbi:MAG: hypothetical protein HW393_442, partial [Dehalococcoidia bacterium]|nr:hypothetical protein [Dehalococcoidia bacterium]